MTTPLPEADAPAATSTSAAARQLWTRSRTLLVALIALLIFGVSYAALRSSENHNALDPRSADPSGSRAVAELLADQGVSTTVVTTTREATATVGPDTTLLITVPDLLTGRQQSALRRAAVQAGGRTVLLSPGPASAIALTPAIEPIAPAGVQVLPPDCDLSAARHAGDATLGGIRYKASASDADTCYPSAGHPSLIRLPAGGGGDIVVLGADDILQNKSLDEQGNASLALQLLGAHPKLVWYLPSLSDTAALSGAKQSFFDLIPDGWTWAGWQLLAAAVLAALWRARRLGPVVAERLPVAVRAAEATEGRARLYHRAGARSRAAEALRTAARERIAPLVGVPPSQAQYPDVLAAAVAARLSDPTTDPGALLHGSPPPNDAALLRLADDLDALEHSILSTERSAIS